ncbi:MAG: hypothetical protein J6L85_03730 [Clostridia bacterium]|nr:hypothetical protein [Clostridia bacterium]
MITETNPVKVDVGALFGYSADRVMAKRRFCFIEILSPINYMRRLASSVTGIAEIDFCAMRQEQREELANHLRSYSEKALLSECGDRIIAFLPSLYPSSSLCVALVFDHDELSASEVLRLVGDDVCDGVISLSQHAVTRPVRMSKELLVYKDLFAELCLGISDCFFDMNRISRISDEDTAKNEIIGQILRISDFTGCPVDSLLEGPNYLNIYSKTDLAMLSAFVMTFMLFAKNTAPTRSVSIDICARSGAASIGISFESDGTLLTSDAILEWEALTADRNMYFEYSEENGRAHVNLHALRYDWSYLGLKQDIEFP